jgi:hypothetical protein
MWQIILNMTEITLNLPEELVLRVQALEEQLPEILELGMREFQAISQIGFRVFGFFTFS